MDESLVLQRLRLDELKLPQHFLCELKPQRQASDAPRKGPQLHSANCTWTTAIPRPMHRISSELIPKPASTERLNRDSNLVIHLRASHKATAEDNGMKEHGLVQLPERAYSLCRTFTRLLSKLSHPANPGMNPVHLHMPEQYPPTPEWHRQQTPLRICS